LVRVPKPRSRFLKVKCEDCGSEQVVFGSTSSKVKCLVCGKVLAEPRGGRAKIRSKVVRVLD